jgi:transcriptional regulator with XRE-family HTH domain
MTDIKHKVGQQIREARKAKGMTQDDLAQKLGVGKPTISKYETGDVNASLEMLDRIAKVLGLEIDLSFK